jgi:hypothetical protein
MAMRITMTTLVKHDGRIYHQADALTVDDELGKYFCACGWATSEDAPTGRAPEHVQLEVQSTQHKLRTEIK